MWTHFCRAVALKSQFSCRTQSHDINAAVGDVISLCKWVEAWDRLSVANKTVHGCVTLPSWLLLPLCICPYKPLYMTPSVVGIIILKKTLQHNYFVSSIDPCINEFWTSNNDYSTLNSSCFICFSNYSFIFTRLMVNVSVCWQHKYLLASIELPIQWTAHLSLYKRV